jgi:hypothetical protein
LGQGVLEDAYVCAHSFDNHSRSIGRDFPRKKHSLESACFGLTGD